MVDADAQFSQVVQQTPLDHLMATYVKADPILYGAGVISYNNTVDDVASITCYFCGGPGHKSKGCPVRVYLLQKWEKDPLRLIAFSRLMKDFKDSKR